MNGVVAYDISTKKPTSSTSINYENVHENSKGGRKR